MSLQQSTCITATKADKPVDDLPIKEGESTKNFDKRNEHSFLDIATDSLLSIAIDRINQKELSKNEIASFVHKLRTIATKIETEHRTKELEANLQQENSMRNTQLMLQSLKNFMTEGTFQIPETPELCILAAHKLNGKSSHICRKFSRNDKKWCLDTKRCKYHGSGRALGRFSVKDMQRALVCKFAILGREFLEKVALLKLKDWEILLECEEVDLLPCCKYFFGSGVCIRLSEGWGNPNDEVDVTLDDFVDVSSIFES